MESINELKDKLKKMKDNLQDELEIYEVFTDLNYYDNFDQFRGSDELTSELFNVEIIYSSGAIEYLSKHDASLKKSIELALEFEFKLEDINSEVLASLLKQKLNSEQFEKDMYDKIEEFYDVRQDIQEQIEDLTEV